MGVSGGTLYRLLNDSFHLMLEQSLSDLGWFDPNRRHRPVTLLPEPVEDDVHVEPNLVTVSVDEISPKYVELGSTFAEHRVRTYVDIYGESKALALSLMGDIKDIVDGRIVSIGREFPTFSVLDLRAATPSKVIVTVMDTHFGEVESANYVLINGSEYNIDYWAPPVGLFGVTVYQAYLSAVDEV